MSSGSRVRNCAPLAPRRFTSRRTETPEPIPCREMVPAMSPVRRNPMSSSTKLTSAGTGPSAMALTAP